MCKKKSFFFLQSGQNPSVRVWELNDNITQVAELQSHKSGIASVVGSKNNFLLVYKTTVLHNIHLPPNGWSDQLKIDTMPLCSVKIKALLFNKRLELQCNITVKLDGQILKVFFIIQEFSPNGKLLVSIGDQHDMLVNVWNWKVSVLQSDCQHNKNIPVSTLQTKLKEVLIYLRDIDQNLVPKTVL